MSKNPHTDSESAKCPQEATLCAAITGELPVDEQTRLAEHLDNCDGCQQRVQQLSGADKILPTNKWVHVDDAQSNALHQVMQRLRRSEPQSRTIDADALFEFLSPASDPKYIGQFGPYDVLELVGRGGMGLVLKAFDRSLNRIVAIKVLLPELATGTEARQRFVREAQAAAAVVHENVVTIHAVDEHNGLPYLVMEFIEGESLQTRIEKGQVEVPEILRIGNQICAGLAAAHAQGLVHRDIKPANILLQNGIARVKITDFGLAKAVDDVSLTRSGTIAGTPQYLSPEQADSQNVDHRTDLFSLGGVLYTMCTGRLPFDGDSTARIIRQVCDQQPLAIAKLNENIPARLVGVVRKLLEKDPRRRYASASEVGQELRQQLAHLQGAPGSQMFTAVGRRSVAIGAAAVTLSALVFFANDSISGWFHGADRGADATHPDLANNEPNADVANASTDFHLASSGELFASLAAAVLAASDGDTIEVRGAGPYAMDVVQIFENSLTIRAAEGFRPEFRFLQGRNGIVSDSDLRLEGLQLYAQASRNHREPNSLRKSVVNTRGDKLEILGCKLRSDDGCAAAFDGVECRIEDSVIVAPSTCGVKWQMRPDASVEIRNCIVVGDVAIGIMRSAALRDNAACKLLISQTNLVGEHAVRYETKNARSRMNSRARLGDFPTLQLHVSRSVVDTERFFQFNAPPNRFLPDSQLAARLLSTLITWTESQNFYRENMKMALFVVRDQQAEFLDDSSLSEWQQHFAVEDPKSLQGSIEYENRDDDEIDYFTPLLTPSPDEDVQIGALRKE